MMHNVIQPFYYISYIKNINCYLYYLASMFGYQDISSLYGDNCVLLDEKCMSVDIKTWNASGKTGTIIVSFDKSSGAILPLEKGMVSGVCVFYNPCEWTADEYMSNNLVSRMNDSKYSGFTYEFDTNQEIQTEVSTYPDGSLKSIERFILREDLRIIVNGLYFANFMQSNVFEGCGKKIFVVDDTKHTQFINNGGVVKEEVLFFSGKKLISEYFHDKKHGSEISLYENGKIERISDYKYGKLHGLVVDFSSEGRAIKYTSYNQGEEVFED